MEAVKITKRLDYKLVITKGTRINSNSFNLQYLNSKTKSIRFGITASKRIGNAVRRNYAKRRIRALIHKLLLNNKILIKDYVIMSKKGILFKKFDNLYEELKLTLNKIDK